MLNIIHQIWFDLGNGSEVPLKYVNYQKSWINLHPNWKYVLWNENSGNELMLKSYPQFYDLYLNVKYPIMKIDLLRYCILDKIGGMYVDIDYKCLNNFDDYLNNNENINYDIFINESPSQFGFKTLSNSLLISKNNNGNNNNFWSTVLLESFNRIKNTNDFNHVYYVNKTTGPLLLNDIVNNEILTKYKIKILPYDQFNFCNSCQKCYPSKTKKLYAFHDYISYWNSNYWLQFRKLFTCIELEQIVFVFLLLIIIYTIYKRSINN
jgi:mannosyltransferase OCH1-like enzyme